MEEFKLELGAKMYLEFKYRAMEIRECVVTKIGNKYFYVDNDNKMGFDKKEFKYTEHEYPQHNLQLFKTRKEIEDKQEYSRLYSLIHQKVGYGNSQKYSLDQLRKVAEILGI